jgi:hypothetical protein
MSGNVRILNALHKATTFTLFAITCAGAYTVVSGSSHILQRRREYTKQLEDAAKAGEESANPKTP